MTKRVLFWGIVILGSVAFGTIISLPGLIVWDDIALYSHSKWVLKLYGLQDVSIDPDIRATWVAVLWPLILGIATEIIFPWLQDPYLVRHALTVALFPMFLVWLWRFVRERKIAWQTSLLIIAMLLGYVRFFGNSLVAARDFPHAVGFLASILLSWKLLMDIRENPRNEWKMITLGAVSVLPFLLRSPNIMPLPVVIAALFLIAWKAPTLSRNEKIIVIVLPAVSAGIFIFFGTPGFWEVPEKIFYPLDLFSNFPWDGTVRTFGMQFKAANLPLWYYPSWILVGTEPLTFFLLLAGASVQCIRGMLHAMKQKTCWSHNLEYWLGLIVFLSWSAVFILRPVDYDEDRHMFFLYLPLIVWAALGLKKLHPRVQAALAMVIIASSVWSTANWGIYTYAYKSPLVSRKAEDYMNDYRALCLNEAAKRIGDILPEGTLIKNLRIPTQEIGAQAARLKKSLLIGDATYKKPRFLPVNKRTEKDVTPYYLISGRGNFIDTNLASEEFAGAEILFRIPMPPYGESACALVKKSV